MKTVLIYLVLFSMTFSVFAGDPTKNSIELKGGRNILSGGHGLYFAASYARHFNNFVSVAPTFVFADRLFGDNAGLLSNDKTMNGEISNSFNKNRKTWATTLDVNFSSKSFGQSGCRHNISIGTGLGVACYYLVWSTRVLGNTVYHDSEANRDLIFAQHLSLTYSYRLCKNIELGVFGDFLKTAKDYDAGAGLSCAVLF